jgi:flagella basal body P-ring formation protein FlgA
MAQPTIQQSTNCDISIPDYTVMREDKIKKINDYYAKLLDSYTTSYANYSKQSTSSNINDKQYAETSLKQNVADYNSQVINLSQTLINNVNQDTDLITDLETLKFFKTNKPLRTGDIIKRSDLNAINLVKAGLKTDVVLENQMIRIKTQGISRGNGAIGDIVEVFHPQKNKKYQGKVIDINKVLVEL